MIELIPIGTVDKDVLEALKEPLKEVFSQRTQIGNSMVLTPESWSQQRHQHLASMLLAAIPLPKPNDRALGVVDVDIFAPGLNFVFGEADITGRRALISLQRLRQEFYGLPGNEKLFRERVFKEAVHELGHTYGLGHCPDTTWVMHFSNSLYDTDLKRWDFCLKCQEKVRREV